MQQGAILIVDDDPALLEALSHTIQLRTTGVEVQTAKDAHDALKMIQRQEYDAIVSDIRMPGMDGLSLLEAVHEVYPDTPILLITGYSDHDQAIRALRGGAYDYILKPIDREDFLAALQRALQTRHLRRHLLEQQTALEHYVLSLERRVEQQTQDIHLTAASQNEALQLISHEIAAPLIHLKTLVQESLEFIQQEDAQALCLQNLQVMKQVLDRLNQLVYKVQQRESERREPSKK